MDSEPPTEILYSEVLQGLSKKPLTPTLKTIEQPKISISFTENSTSTKENFTNFTVLNSKRVTTPASEEGSKSFNFSKLKSPLRFSNKYHPIPHFAPLTMTQPIRSNLLYQANAPVKNIPAFNGQARGTTFQTSLLETTRHRISVIPPISASYVQQTYFYPPIPGMQRWIPNSYYPPQIMSSWVAQQGQGVVNNVNKMFSPAQINTGVNDDAGPSSQKENFKDNDSSIIQDKLEQNPETEISDEHKVSASISEELEIQALEQYNNSNENFYQELERQAAEQYASSPE